MNHCPICSRDKHDKFCTYHQIAYNNLKEMYEKWKTAAGFTWNDYLKKIGEIEDTGKWIREIIEFITTQSDL